MPNEKHEIGTTTVRGFEIHLYSDGSSAVGRRLHSDPYDSKLERYFMVAANVTLRRAKAGLVVSRQLASGRWANEDVGGGLISVTDKPVGEFQSDLELAQNTLDVACDNTIKPHQKAPESTEPQDHGRRTVGGPGTKMPLFIFKD